MVSIPVPAFGLNLPRASSLTPILWNGSIQQINLSPLVAFGQVLSQLRENIQDNSVEAKTKPNQNKKQQSCF